MNEQEKITIDVIQRLLQEQSKSKKELCEYLDVAPTNFGNWVSGRNVSFMKYTHKIAKFFGVSVSYLLNGEEKEKTPNEDNLTEGEKMLLALFRQVPEDKQPHLIQLIKVALGMQ